MPASPRYRKAQALPGRLLPASRLEALSGGVFAIAITLLVKELHGPAGQEALVKSLGREWPRYLGYFVSFTFIGGVWIAHSNMTRFTKAADAALMRLNLMLLLFVSPFSTAIVATRLFVSLLPFTHLTVTHAGLPAERAAVVLFGLNLTLAALTVYLVIRHGARRAARPTTWPRRSYRPSPGNAGQQCCSRQAPPSWAPSCP